MIFDDPSEPVPNPASKKKLGGDKVTKSREEKRNNITKLFRSPPPPTINGKLN